jgi:hypothetical protein
MADDIDQRLAAAAESLREYEVIWLRICDLEARIEQVSEQLVDLRLRRLDEQEDVERLERLSLTSVLAALRGARGDQLARERAEADEARYRLAEAEERRSALRRSLMDAKIRLSRVATARTTYAALLAEKERHLSESGDPRGARLLELAAERGRLTGEVRELDEALRAAESARAALSRVGDMLRNASAWSTYDTFLGGGVISSAIKHSRLDEAARAAAYADQRLAVLRTELADVPGTGTTGPQLAVDGLTRFADVWLDNIFTDLAVRSRIKRAQDNVAPILTRGQRGTRPAAAASGRSTGTPGRDRGGAPQPPKHVTAVGGVVHHGYRSGVAAPPTSACDR